MTTRHVVSLLAAALVAVACSDTAGPRQPSPRFSAAAPTTGITLDQTTGVLPDAEAWPAGGTHIGKDFPTSPHLGDAIVVTFFWRGTTNTITTVSDHFCDANSTPIGNTYTLVEYVTAGGYSMATYVATNVQGFPVPAPTADKKLCVHALFSNVEQGQLSLTGEELLQRLRLHRASRMSACAGNTRQAFSSAL